MYLNISTVYVTAKSVFYLNNLLQTVCSISAGKSQTTENSHKYEWRNVFIWIVSSIIKLFLINTCHIRVHKVAFEKSPLVDTQKKTSLQFSTYSSFHLLTSPVKRCRPRSCRVSFCSCHSFCSTTVCVAMPAWSTPGTQSVTCPHIRCLVNILHTGPTVNCPMILHCKDGGCSYCFWFCITKVKWSE